MHRFESHSCHIFFPNLQETDSNRECSERSESRNNYRAHLDKKTGICTIIDAGWSSGLRRCVKAAVSSERGFESHYCQIFSPNLQETDNNRECSDNKEKQLPSTPRYENRHLNYQRGRMAEWSNALR